MVILTEPIQNIISQVDTEINFTPLIILVILLIFIVFNHIIPPEYLLPKKYELYDEKYHDA